MSPVPARKSFHYKQSHATLLAEERFLGLAERTWVTAYRQVEGYAALHPRFSAALEPLPVDMAAPPLVRRMAAAAALAGVGPMAAVAGAIAQTVVEELVRAGCRHVIVDNGGDVVLRLEQPVTVGVFTGPAQVRDIALRCEPRPGIFSVCTSSGTIGHSLSFGRADAATVIAASGFLADAFATALGNRVGGGGEQEMERAIRQTLSDDVEGLLVVAGARIGMGGRLPALLRAAVDPRRIRLG